MDQPHFRNKLFRSFTEESFKAIIEPECKLQSNLDKFPPYDCSSLLSHYLPVMRFALTQQTRRQMGNLALHINRFDRAILRSTCKVQRARGEERGETLCAMRIANPGDRGSQGVGGEVAGTGVGNGVVSVGVLAAKLMLLARPTLGHKSKRLVRLRKTLFELTTPLFKRSVELAPAPPSAQLK